MRCVIYFLVGSVKWNLEAPSAPMTVSKIPNCPAVRVPIITHRGMRPTVQSFMNPVSLAIFASRTIMVPSPPAPALFTLDSSVSAGVRDNGGGHPGNDTGGQTDGEIAPAGHLTGAG